MKLNSPAVALVPACATALRPPAAYVPRAPVRTALYALVREQRATFARVACGEAGAPAFVNDAFERLLRCGVLAHGFARFHCGACEHEHLVPLSCKTRGLCPSCGGRRMMALTRHVLDASARYRLRLKTRWRDGTRTCSSSRSS